MHSLEMDPLSRLQICTVVVMRVPDGAKQTVLCKLTDGDEKARAQITRRTSRARRLRPPPGLAFRARCYKLQFNVGCDARVSRGWLPKDLTK